MNFWKKLAIIVMNILMIPLSLFISFGASWFILKINEQSNNIIFKLTQKIMISNNLIFWLMIGSIICYLLFTILLAILGRKEKARYRNGLVHLNTWSMCLICVAMTIITFIQDNPLENTGTIITTARKIGIGLCIICLVIFHMFSRKITTIINRRIQAYETAKESNIVGRSSVIFTNLLKLFEIFFPEMIVLTLLCICISWNLASYFIVVLIACVIPVLGNIQCDLNIRAEIKRKQEIEKKALVQDVANAIKGDIR